jgi:hypothetical protein
MRSTHKEVGNTGNTKQARGRPKRRRGNESAQATKQLQGKGEMEKLVREMKKP